MRHVQYIAHVYLYTASTMDVYRCYACIAAQAETDSKESEGCSEA